MTQEDYDRVKAAIRARYERDLESLERVWELAKGLEEVPSDRESLTQSIRSLCYNLPGQFSSTAVQELLMEAGIPASPATVTSTLNRMVISGDLQLVRAGKGRHPSFFKKARDFSLQQGEGTKGAVDANQSPTTT